MNNQKKKTPKKPKADQQIQMITSQNLTGMNKIAKPDNRFNLSIEPSDATELRPSHSNMAQLPKQENEPASDSEFTGTYLLPSGKRTRSKMVLIDEPENDIRVWKGNPRAEVDADVSDLVPSIQAVGTNTQPAILRENAGLELIVGTRRRKATIVGHKPLTGIILEQCDDEDALQIAIIENENRKDPNVFLVVNSYNALLQGENPICKNYTDVANRLGKSREWITKLIKVYDLPKQLTNKLPEKEKEYISQKKAISLAKKWLAAPQDKQKTLIDSFKAKKTITAKEYIDGFLGLDKEASKPKIPSMNIEEQLSENISLVSNKAGQGVYINLPKDTNSNDVKALLQEYIARL